MSDVVVSFSGWNASGVSWGDQGWGVGSTNVSAAGEVGTVSAIGAATASPTGVQATGVLGAVTVSGVANTAVTGVEATAELGTVSIALGIDVEVTGEIGRAHV